jgi:hypothetical protein
MHHGNGPDDQQARDQKPDPDKHDRFDHELRSYPPTVPESAPYNATGHARVPASAGVNPNRHRDIEAARRIVASWRSTGTAGGRPSRKGEFQNGFQVAVGVNFK